jgi:tRNA pseudouridine38-40 synthase
MSAAALLLEGKHDFAAFCGTGGSAKTTVRRVYSSRLSRVAPDGTWAPWGCAVERPSGNERLIYEVTADGFLRHMVRTIVGTLVEIGAGRRDAASIGQALASRRRADAGPTAPACGLCLVSVKYGDAADAGDGE